MSSFLSSIFGDKDLVKFDTDVDSILNDMPVMNTTDQVEDQTGQLIDSFLSTEKDDSFELGSIFDNVTIPKERLARYDTYEELYRSVPIIKRIMRVYKANVLQKNPVTGQCIIYRDVDNVSENTEQHKSNLEKVREYCKNVAKVYNLSNKLLTQVIPTQHLFGDCFIEVVDVKKEADKVDLNKYTSYLTEIDSQLTYIENKLKTSTEYGKNEKLFDSILECISNLVVVDDEGPYYESENVIKLEESSDSAPTNNPFNNILLKIHKPKKIIILDTDYGTRIGYLEVSDSVAVESTNIGMALSNTIGKLNFLAMKNAIPKEVLVNKLISFILKKIIAKSSVKGDTDKIIRSLGEDTYLFIKRLFIEQGANTKDGKLNIKSMKTRFIPANRMIQFSIPSSDNFPYGESIVDPLVFPCKLYVLAQLSKNHCSLH